MVKVEIEVEGQCPDGELEFELATQKGKQALKRLKSKIKNWMKKQPFGSLQIDVHWGE